MALKVKGSDASAEQLRHGQMCVEICRGRGGDAESCAGTVATAIQESVLRNMRGGDRDSAGLFQQRPSMGWGSYAQVTDPAYAINKFLDKFLAYRRQGQGWMQASHNTQRSAFASAPAKWYPEGVAFANAFGGSGGGLSAISLGTSDAAGGTGTQPYEFSRGSADAPESTFVASRRLADEVDWRFFARGGAIWYVSDNWLEKQPVAYRINEFTPGVVALSFEYETRGIAADASLRVITKRYSMLPGDVVELEQEGPGSGKWLVKEVRRSLYSQVADVALTRKRPKLPEPAPAAAVGTQDAGAISLGSSGELTGDTASKIYQAAQQATSKNWAYSQPRRNQFDRYADCSSGVSWVLTSAGVPVPSGWRPGSGNAPVSGNYTGWGQAGRGQRVTVWTNSGHIWIQFHGFTMWRFDTGGGSGGKLHGTPRSTGGFIARHWAGT
jgi:hypothetical protein